MEILQWNDGRETAEIYASLRPVKKYMGNSSRFGPPLWYIAAPG
jgi:hypothetical protein